MLRARVGAGAGSPAGEAPAVSAIPLDKLQLSEAVRRLNPDLGGCHDSDAGEIATPAPSATARRAELKRERDPQAQVEGWLANRGYSRLTSGDIAAGPPERGYFFHLAQPRGNPLLLDLLILDRTGRALQLELKMPPVKWQPGQAELISQGFGRLACSFEDAVKAVTDWEQRNNGQ